MMGTQGAWDSRMTKEQSATIFGLTAIFSSKLIYNLQSRIQEDHIDNLDYFTTFATTVLQSMQGHEEDTMIFQQSKKNQNWMTSKLWKSHHILQNSRQNCKCFAEIRLEFLIRDWEHYEDGMDFMQCVDQVELHLKGWKEENFDQIERFWHYFRKNSCLEHRNLHFSYPKN